MPVGAGDITIILVKAGWWLAGAEWWSASADQQHEQNIASSRIPKMGLAFLDIDK
jgi:hypothetical protein